MLAVIPLAQDGEWAAGLRLERPGERVGCGPLTGHVTGRGLRDGGRRWSAGSAERGCGRPLGDPLTDVRQAIPLSTPARLP